MNIVIWKSGRKWSDCSTYYASFLVMQKAIVGRLREHNHDVEDEIVARL